MTVDTNQINNENAKESTNNMKHFRNQRRSYEKLSSYLYGATLAYCLVITASSAPYLYVNDEKANCGAKFLLHISREKIIICVAMVFVTSIVRMLTEIASRQIAKADKATINMVFIALSFATVMPFLKMFIDLLLFMENPPGFHYICP